jgi:hypothetical protein
MTDTTRFVGVDSTDPWLPDIVKVRADKAKIDDLAGNFGATDVEGALAELSDTIDVMGGAGGGLVAASAAETIAGTSTTKAVTPNSHVGSMPYLDVRAFGATGDGTTNDAAAIQAALTAAGATLNATTQEVGATVVFPPGVYNLGTTGLTARCAIDMRPGARLAYTGTGVALLVDNINSGNINVSVRRGTVGWNTAADTTSVGVRLRNTSSIRARLDVRNFAVGVDLYGDALGTCYNVVDLCDVINNKVGVRCTGVAAGWANQNEFHGRIRIDSAYTSVAGSRYIDLTTGGNGSTFDAVTLEANTPEWTVDCSVNFVTFLNCRWEQAKGVRVNTNGNVQIIGGWGNSGVGSKNGGLATVIGLLGSQLYFDATPDGTSHGLELVAATSQTHVVLTTRAKSTGLTYGELTARGELSLWRSTGKGGGATPEPVVKVDGFNSKIYFGDGTAAPTAYLGAAAMTRVEFGPATATFRTLGDLWVMGKIDHDGTTIGFYGAAPVTRPTVPAAATDAATTQTLVNALRTALVNLGLVQ